MINTQRKHRILVCISGSIAAYKAADLVSLLTKAGHDVQCLMTEGAKNFVTPLVLETLSHRPALSKIFGREISGTEHIRLARWAQVIAFVPVTANLLAKLSYGIADDLVTTVALATQAPWVVAPAMNSVMWAQPAVQENCQRLLARGAQFVEPTAGVLACGEEGDGKLASPESIAELILKIAASQPDTLENPAEPSGRIQDFLGQTLLITAGPTRSHIDAVRYLTNPSTGKMGAALAEEALARGAHVKYVLGVDKGVVTPEALGEVGDRLEIRAVLTAEEMAKAALEFVPHCTGIIATAAVLDYRFENSNPIKEKRGSEPITLKLLPSTDVLGSLKASARPDQWFLGFAAETDDIENYARSKLQKKRLDWIFANRVARQGEVMATGFGSSTNAGILLSSKGERLEFTLAEKTKLASQILDEVIRAFREER